MGFAVDLGTTKIAGYLVDLETGEELAATGIMNPQIGYGEDVISRLVHAGRNDEGRHELARVVREGLNNLIVALAFQAGVAQEQIAEACIVGNTAMTHLLLELPVQQLAVSPFVAATSSALDVKARDLDLDIAPGAYVHILPCVGGFVGADHVAMIIGSDLDRDPHARHRRGHRHQHRNRAAYAPTKNISPRRRARPARPSRARTSATGCAPSTGAIEAVLITPDGVEIKTIGDAPAVGLCGSGIVDIVAEMHRNHIIDRRGRLDPRCAGCAQGRSWLRVACSCPASAAAPVATS